jgi:phytoene dehydrogenase-like protein
MSKLWDVVVIGAGPAGMASASGLAEYGLSVLLIDQNQSPGGQIYRNLEMNQSQSRLMAILGPDYARGTSLLERLAASSVHLAMGYTVWRIEPNGTVWAKNAEAMERHDSGCPADHAEIRRRCAGG